ncbi:MAG: CBS domain-containing protein [Actinobacteria bacterium]|nr:CBS domain-containing protein [Actinomycetota bacterium]
MTVRVGIILDRKGGEVVTIDPGASIANATQRLREHNIGALVVSSDGRQVEGILSERDVVRRMAQEGADCLHLTVGEVMTTEVTTCGRDRTADELMALMTNSRIRHVPVVEDGGLVGIISIGDVVKSRMDELETKAQALEEYVTGSGYGPNRD